MTFSSALLTMFLCGFLGLVVPGAGYFTYLEYKKRLRRLPDATEFENLSEKISQMKIDLASYEDQIRGMQEDLVKRDYAASELEECRLRKQQVESELLLLQPHLMELERVNQELASQTEVLTKLRQDIEQSKFQYDDLQHQIKVLPITKDQLEKEILNLENQSTKLKELVQTLMDQRNELTNEIGSLEPIKNSLVEDVEKRKRELASETESLARLRQDIEQSKIQLEELQHQINILPITKKQLEKDVANLENRSTKLQETLQNLGDLRNELKNEIRSLEPIKKSLVEDVEKGKKTLEEIDHDVRERHLMATSLKKENAILEQTQASLQGAVSTVQSIQEESLEKSLEDLVAIEPACFKGRPKPYSDTSETNALEKLYNHLEGLNLYYSKRVLKSFHTNLKISQISPMVALAGISGTGKSELPKRYSEAMGLHFLQVAVQPRWDSPQDLFGFYNYLEQRYKATELARSMVRLDPWNWPKLAKPYKDRILMVLLDEMNLARVEYYFSEFLSRLEGRKSVDEAEEFSRQPVEIELDLGKKQGEQGSKRVYPSQNVFFVGTMNEDESTQSMSDKVIDRAPVIRFARPKKLESNPPDVSPDTSEHYLPFSTWTNWRRKVSELSDETMDHLDRWISRLNESLDTFGRPFGHRLNQAIIAYVANHPDMIVDETVHNARRAFADQLEQRIFPKLRGIEMDDQYNEKAYKTVLALVKEELHDEELARAFEKSKEKVLFSWVGVQREEEK